MILFIGINGFRNGQLNLGLAGKIKIWCEVIIGFTLYIGLAVIKESVYDLYPGMLG